MDTQTLLTIAGPLAGVALGALLASQFQGRHWFRDRRLDAFAAAQTAIYKVFAAAPYAAVEELEVPERVRALLRLDEAINQWQEARARLGLLAGKSVVITADQVHEVLRDMGMAATKDDRTGWDERNAKGKELRGRLNGEMRKELNTDNALVLRVTRMLDR